MSPSSCVTPAGTLIKFNFALLCDNITVVRTSYSKYIVLDYSTPRLLLCSLIVVYKKNLNASKLSEHPPSSWCPCMTINVSVQYNGGLLSDIKLSQIGEPF